MYFHVHTRKHLYKFKCNIVITYLIVCLAKLSNVAQKSVSMILMPVYCLVVIFCFCFFKHGIVSNMTITQTLIKFRQQSSNAFKRITSNRYHNIFNEQWPIFVAVNILCSALVAHIISHTRQDVVMHTHCFQNNSSTAVSLLL